MTPHDDIKWKIERSSLGTPVARRIRARTNRDTTEAILQRALRLVATTPRHSTFEGHDAHRPNVQTESVDMDSAGIVMICLYSSAEQLIARCSAEQERKGRSIVAHGKTTGSKAASNAGKVLSNPKSSKAAKSAAASALAQKHGKGRKR